MSNNCGRLQVFFRVTSSMLFRFWRFTLIRIRLLAVRARFQDITWSRGLNLGRRASISATDGGRIALGRNVTLSDGVTVVARGGVVKIGDFAFVGAYTTLVSQERVEVGAACLIAERVSIRDQDHNIHAGHAIPISDAGFATAPVSIGEGSWVGAGAVVLKGAQIGRGAVVAANAVVRQDVADFEVVGGVPAKRIGWRRETDD